jgi:EAL domain-containing protein (putative c-di-GMP-specific phosphodiesterase class I)
MEDERGQLVAPMAFIPAAERYGLMGRINRWVIEQSCTLLAARKGERELPCLTINLSASSLSDPDLPSFVGACLERNALPADRLGFEISETLAITQLHRAIRLMRELKALGCRTALDDFGGGMSAFVYLRDLKIDYLKIDGNLVCEMTRDPVMYAMVESIHHVARVMGIGTIAEWAEESPQVDALSVIGVDYAQGYAVHRPEPLEDCLRGLSRPGMEKPSAPDATRARNSGPLRLVP